MVVTCPQCKVRLKVDDAKVPPQGGRFKCPKCSTAIFVKLPETPVSPSSHTITVTEKTPSRQPEKKEALDKTKVLIAHGDNKLLSEMESLIKSAGFIPIVSRDGIEAIVKASKELPFVAVLDVALPKEYGFDVCKKLKEIEYTKDIKVILVASVYDKTRYKRPPASLYGADDIIEDHEIKDSLIPKIEALKAGISSETQPTVTSCYFITQRPIPKGFDSFVPPTVTSPQGTVTSPQGTVTSPPKTVTSPQVEPSREPPIEDDMVEKARRLARTIISDIYFYNPKKFDEAVKQGTFYESFKEELKEGLKLYESRIPHEIRRQRDYFREEIDAFIENKRKASNL
jgi:predicted Zn finger-like uncharacterized protein